jgi:hypothetical protein
VAQQTLLRDFGPTAMNLFKSPTTRVHDDERQSTSLFRSISPNPAVDNVVVRVNVDAHADAGLTLSDVQGRVLRTFTVDAWSGTCNVSVQGLSAGTYVLTLRADRAVAHTFLHVTR